MSNILTCVYCGQQYPEGTPPHGAQILTDHIKICEKHPMRELEQRYVKVRSALVGLVGVDTKEDLDNMETVLRLARIPEADKVITINAITALKDTLN